MKTTNHTSSQKARLASLALGGCALLIAGCADRDVANRPASAEDPLIVRDPAVGAPAPGANDAARSAPPSTNANRAENKDNTTMVLNEEQLRVQKREVDAGGVLITKDVETRQVSEPVELRREEVDVQRLSPEEARQRGIAVNEQGQQRIDEGQVFIPLSREEAVAQKEVATTGVVQAQTRAETAKEDVDATLRREVVDVQRQGEADPAVGAAANPAARQLEQRIRTELNNSAQNLQLQPQQIQQLRIQVQDGNNVRLGGKVPSEDISDKLEARINDIEGVGMVQNELEVGR